MSNNTPFEQSLATARKVSPLRQRMIDDMMVRNLAANTMVCYLKQVSYFARHFGRSPDRLGAEEIRSYQIYSSAPGEHTSRLIHHGQCSDLGAIR